MSEHLDRLVALHEAQLVSLDAHWQRSGPECDSGPVHPVEQPARLRVHDLPRDVVRGLAKVLDVVQHGRDLGQLQDAVAEALRAPAVDDGGTMAA